MHAADVVASILAGSITLPTPPGGTVVLTYGAGGNLLTGPVRAVEGAVQQLTVFVLQSGGPPPVPYLGTGEGWHVTAVQVSVRSAVNSFGAGEALARALHARAHLATPAGGTSLLAQESDPVYLGVDDEGAHRHVFSLWLGHRR